jgi:hypothetical protein
MPGQVGPASLFAEDRQREWSGVSTCLESKVRTSESLSIILVGGHENPFANTSINPERSIRQ